MLYSKQTIVTLIVLVLAAVLAACTGTAEPVEPHPAAKGSEPVNERTTLEGTDWVLISLNGNSLIEGTNITLNFAEGVLSGFAGCNDYGAACTFDGSSFTFETPAATEMACSGPAGIKATVEHPPCPH